MHGVLWAPVIYHGTQYYLLYKCTKHDVNILLWYPTLVAVFDKLSVNEFGRSIIVLWQNHPVLLKACFGLVLQSVY